MANPYYESALTERAGVEQPMQVNPNFKRHKKSELTVDDYVKGILEGNRTILSRAITMIESENPTHIAMAQTIIERCLPHSGNSLRIGITGVPGVGKSTFIESFGGMLTAQGHKLAVLAIDPSSERTKGSILGDKTRMETLSVDPSAFIRPSPSGSALGGVADSLGEDWGGLFGSLGGMMSDVINAEVEILGDYGAVLKSFELKAGDSVRITLSEGTALQITDGTCVLIAD